MSHFTDGEVLKMNDLRMKIYVARNVVTACHVDKERQSSCAASAKNPMLVANAIRYYTGLDMSLIFTHMVDYLKQPLSISTFAEWYDLNDQINPVFNKKIRDCILNYYLKEAKIPTISLLKTHIDDNGTDQEILRKLRLHGYIQKLVGDNTKAVIIEKPEVTLERMRYLEAMKRYRAQDCEIVYVDSNRFETIDESSWDYIAVSAKIGVLGTRKVLNGEGNCDVEVDKLMIFWIVEEIIPQLSANSVIVIENEFLARTTSNVPKIDSSRKAMLHWLLINHIPHSENMHSAELYELIKISKRHYPNRIYRFDNIVKSKGHHVLRRPKNTDCLNFFDLLWLKLRLQSSYIYKKKIYESMINSTSGEWKELENTLIRTESKMLAEDVIFENIIDKLLTLGKYNPSSKMLFEMCDDATGDLKLANKNIIRL